MFPVPLTFCFDFAKASEGNLRSIILHEFAINGAKHIVLPDTMMGQIMLHPSLAETFRKEVEKEGMTLVDSHGSFGTEIDLIACGVENRRLMKARHQFELAIASTLGIKTMTLHIGHAWRCPPEGYALAGCMDRLRDALDTLVPAAESYGVAICLENIWDQNDTPEILVQMCQEYNSPCLGVCYDSGHANCFKTQTLPLPFDCHAKESWNTIGVPDEQIPWDDHVLEKVLPYVFNCHLHDNHGIYDEHNNIGNGTVNWKHIIGLLRQAPQLKSIMCEVSFAKLNGIRTVCESFQKLSEL